MEKIKRQPKQIKLHPQDDIILRNICSPVIEINTEIRNIYLEMMYWMSYYKSGVGLAANQLGFDKRIICINPSLIDTSIILINPVITDMSDLVERDYEECLSIPGTSVLVPRPIELTVKYQDIDFKQHISHVTKLMARIICHEVNHLDGKLIVDYEKRAK